MDNQELAKKLLELCGGADNIELAENCMTRLRVMLADANLAKHENIKACEGVYGIVGDGKDIQIIIGPGKAAKVTNEFNNLCESAGKTNNNTNKPATQNKQTEGKAKDILKKLSQIFVPLIPGIIGAGLLLGIASILNLLVGSGTIPDTKPLKIFILLITLIAQGCMSFLAIFVGINSAKVFKCSPILGGVIGGIVLLEGVTELAVLVNELGNELFNLNNLIYNEADPQYSLLSAGKGGVIGVVVGVWILSKIENWLHKKVPESLDLIIVPLVTLFISGTLMIFVIMPLAGLLSTGIITVLGFLGQSEFIVVRMLYGFILGATFLPMVMLGLHQSLIPIYFLQLDQLGYITIIAAQMMAGGANIGCAIIIYFKAKSVGFKNLQKAIAGSLPSAILGVHEPLIYSMTLPITISFIPIGIGAGIGGIWCVLMNVYALSYGPATLPGVTTMQPESMLNYLIGLVISCACAAACTQFMITKGRILKFMQDSEGEKALKYD